MNYVTPDISIWYSLEGTVQYITHLPKKTICCTPLSTSTGLNQLNSKILQGNLFTCVNLLDLRWQKQHFF